MKIKLLFLFEMPKEHEIHWQDGLWAALEILSKEWFIDKRNLSWRGFPQFPDYYDFILCWGSLTRPWLEELKRAKTKKGLCFAGGPTAHINAHLFDIIFTESQVDLEAFKRMGVNSAHAFGVNADIMRPIQQPKIFDFIYPAAFALWKRHWLFVQQSQGRPALAVGYMQPNEHEKECYEICQQNGVMIMPWVPYEVMPYLYNASKMCLITADAYGGCQRTVLEAIACGIPVSVCDDAIKLQELKDLTREEVLANWSEKNYVEQLKRGIESVL